jgi:hypothetical protein
MKLKLTMMLGATAIVFAAACSRSRLGAIRLPASRLGAIASLVRGRWKSSALRASAKKRLVRRVW